MWLHKPQAPSPKPAVPFPGRRRFLFHKPQAKSQAGGSASPLEKEGYSEFVPLRITRRCGRKIIVAAPEEVGADAGQANGGGKAADGTNPLIKQPVEKGRIGAANKKARERQG